MGDQPVHAGHLVGDPSTANVSDRDVVGVDTPPAELRQVPAIAWTRSVRPRQNSAKYSPLWSNSWQPRALALARSSWMSAGFPIGPIAATLSRISQSK